MGPGDATPPELTDACSVWSPRAAAPVKVRRDGADPKENDGADALLDKICDPHIERAPIAARDPTFDAGLLYADACVPGRDDAIDALDLCLSIVATSL